jgi:RNA polymerase sigma-70 factor (ECF subfamily)
LVLRAGGEHTKASSKALDELCQAYREPLREFARRCRQPDPDRAEDLVQGFFLHLLERNGIGAADPARGQFRKFLQKALINYANNLYNAETAQKRDGRAHFVKTDPDELSSGAPSAEQLCDKMWADKAIKRGLARLREEQVRIGRGALFEALREGLADDDDGPPLREVAAALGMSEGAVKVTRHRLRRRLVELVRAEVSETVAQPEDVDAELRHLRASKRRKK